MELSTIVGDEMHAVLRAAAAAGPTAVDDATGAVYVLHHDDVERLAHDRRLAGIGLSMFDLLGVPDGPLRRWYGGLMFTNEGDAHGRLRSLVSRAFTPRAVDALRRDAGALAAAGLEPLRQAGGGDVVAALQLLPMQVMCQLLGVPAADVEVFGGWADDLSPVFGFMTPEQIAAADDAIVQLVAYVEDLVARRADDPRRDLITALLAAEHEGGRLTHDEVVTMVANLLVAGHDTTASQLACTWLTFVRHRDAAAQVRDDPSLVAPAVAEMLRFEPSIAGVPRTLCEPVEIGGQSFDAETVVLLMTAAANRQPGVWKAPDTFDVERFADPHAPRLLTFGAGLHYCLGAALARLTVEEALLAVVGLGRVEPAEDPWAVPWRSLLGRAPERVLVEVAP